jgi:hypothetical protein
MFTSRPPQGQTVKAPPPSAAARSEKADPPFPPASYKYFFLSYRILLVKYVDFAEIFIIFLELFGVGLKP